MSFVAAWTRNDRLAAAAAAELASRDKHYPAMIDAGEIDAAIAAEDLDAWRAIAALFDTGTTDAPLFWSELEDALRRAIVSRDAAIAEQPTSSVRILRRAAVADLQEQVARSRAAWFAATVRPAA